MFGFARLLLLRFALGWPADFGLRSGEVARWQAKRFRSLFGARVAAGHHRFALLRRFERQRCRLSNPWRPTIRSSGPLRIGTV
jgi:hypothetical protein